MTAETGVKDGKAANRDLRDLKAMYNWGMKEGLIKENPFKDIEKFPEDPFIKVRTFP